MAKKTFTLPLAAYFFRNTIRNAEPCPGTLYFRYRRPRWYWFTMRRANGSPKPHPRVFVVKPLSKMCFCTDDDMVPPENELRYYEALHRNGVPCEMHAFPAGGHGWGFRTEQFGEDPFRDFRHPFFQAMARFISER